MPLGLSSPANADVQPKISPNDKPAKTVGIDTERRLRYNQRMFGISGEHLLILGIVLIFFGPKRLPELGNTLGKAIRNFKDSLSGVEEASFRKIMDTPAPQPPKATAVVTPVTSEGPSLTPTELNPDGSKKV